MNNYELTDKIKMTCEELIYVQGFISSVDILKKLNYLSEKDYTDWRFGRVLYLEKVCTVNLSKLSLIAKVIRKFAHDLDLKHSYTAYHKHGKGAKIKLRFSKSGDEKIEHAYATHYLDVERIDELKQKKQT